MTNTLNILLEITTSLTKIPNCYALTLLLMKMEKIGENAIDPIRLAKVYARV